MIDDYFMNKYEASSVLLKYIASRTSIWLEHNVFIDWQMCGCDQTPDETRMDSQFKTLVKREIYVSI